MKDLMIRTEPPSLIERPNTLRHSWVVLQCVPSAASARDIEQFFEGITLSPPLDSSPLDGVIAVYYSLSGAQEEVMDVYVRCQTSHGAHVASLRSNEPLVVSNQPNSHPVTVRTNPPPCEIYWARGVGVHLYNKRSGMMMLESYLSDFNIPRSLLVFNGPSFQSHVHSALFRLLNPSLNVKPQKPMKRKRDTGRAEANQEDRLTEQMWLLSGRESCAMIEAQFGFLRRHTDGFIHSEDPMESFLGPGMPVVTRDATILSNQCPSCALLLRDIESLMTALSNLWAMLLVHSKATPVPERSPLDYLDRYWQSYAGLYKLLLKEYHRKGKIASCSAHG
jgi:hypothetical protein